ncbi:MAG: 30S ribosomal protein S21 [Porphyromonas sp.]|nr:30S ribosomal protein S21 [Porphyromonas sp.]
MIIVPIKKGENIERALKKFKRKFDRTGTMRKLREGRYFKKPSAVKRRQMEKARYVQKLRQEEDW